MELRAAIVGAGGMGKRHTRSLKTLGVEIDAICDENEASLTSYFEAFPELKGAVKPFFDFDEMLATSNASLYIITLPPFAQKDQFVKAAAAGKHIFIEKPIALDIGTAERMVEAAEAAGIVTSVGFHMRQGVVVKKLKALMASGFAGKPVLFNARYACNSLHAPWWRQKDRSGGQIFEQVIHLYDLSRQLVGEPKSVHCLMSNICHKDVENYTVEDVSTSISMTDSGAISSISATNCAVPGKWSESFTAVFEHVTVECAGVNSAKFTYTDRVPVETEEIHVDDDNHLHGLEEFIRCAAQGTQTGCPISEGLKSLRFVDAATLSAEQGGSGIYLE